jgi:hypothetical protein
MIIIHGKNKGLNETSKFMLYVSCNYTEQKLDSIRSYIACFQLATKWNAFAMHTTIWQLLILFKCKDE